MFLPKTSMLLVLALFIESASRADAALIVPYTENFTSGASNWTNNIGTPPSYVSTGGIDGVGDGYISYTKGLDNSPQTIFRGPANFFGDWIAGGVETFSFYFRHNYAGPLTIGARFAVPNNFPAWAIETANIPPNVWTLMSFDIDPNNPDFQRESEEPEGSFENVFSDIATLQIAGTSPGGAIMGVTFNLDKVSILPVTALLTGDVNNDHVVNQLDLNVVFGNWLSTGVGLNQGDANGDGVINQLDINTITGNWLATGSAGGVLSTTAVPEPSAWMLAILGTTGMAGFRRFKTLK